MIPADIPPAVYEFLACLSQCDFAYRDELPPEFEAPLAVARATDPPLIHLFDFPGSERKVIDHNIPVRLPRLGVRLTRDGSAALALYDMRKEGSAAKPKHGGRRRRSEAPNEEKVLAVLCLHHGYENGEVSNHEPATARGLKAQFGLSTAALSRFLN
jgi:hypothetical protein